MGRQDFRSIVAEFDALKRRIGGDEAYNETDAEGGTTQKGFAEAPQAAAGLVDLRAEERRLQEVEALALDYEISDIADLEAKLDFILERVSELTDEREEFLRYADALRHSVLALIRAREESAARG